MSQVSLTGNDTISIGGSAGPSFGGALGGFLATLAGASYILTAFGDGDNAELTFPNDLTMVKTGKNGNSIYSLNAPGQQAQLVVRILRGTPDHKYLNSIQQAYLLNPPGFVLLTSKLTKRIGDGRGGITNNIYNLTGGVPTKRPGTVSNVEGNTDQALAVFTYMFTGSLETIQ